MRGKAIDAFVATMNRATTLYNLHSSGTAGRPRREKEDILRAAVMMAMAGVDCYFHDKVLERLTPYLKARQGRGLPGDFIELLRKKGGVTTLMEILYARRPHRRLHTLVKKAQADLTFQKPDKIERGLKMIGISDFWYKVARRMGRRASKDWVRRKLAQYGARRDKIAHEADRESRGRTRPITRPYTRGCLTFVERFVRAADAVIDRATGG